MLWALTLIPSGCREADDAPVPTPRPNVLLVTIDTLRADHVGAYGGTQAETPTLDSLAKGGVLFEHAVTHVPLTLPAHTSLFTSLIPPAHGVRDNATFQIDDAHVTLPELFLKEGYRTGAFVGAFVLDDQFGLAQGFETYDDQVEAAENDRPADAVLASAERWIDNLPPDDRWFAFVHLFDPHAPYEAPAPFRQKYTAAPYAGEVAYADDALGRFLERLRRSGRLENTLVVVTSDHGEGLGEHGERTHGMFAYETTLHVPFILSWPKRLPEGRRVSSRVRHIDVAPTVAELAGFPAPDEFSGRSLVALVEGREAAVDRDSYFESLTYNFNFRSAPLTGIYRDRLKLVALPIPELYDLDADPDEQNNLAIERARTMREMSTLLSETIRAAHRSDGPDPTPVDESTRARLESLGYFSSPTPFPHPEEYGPADDPKNWIHVANLFDEAVNLHRARRPAEAIQLLRAILAEKGTVAIAHARLAQILREEGRTEEAIAVLEDALASGVRHPRVINGLGTLLRETSNEERWSEVLLDLVATNPADADAVEALAGSFLRRGLLDEAVPHLVRLLGLRPDDARAHASLGAVFLQTGRYDESERHLRRSLELDDAEAETWNVLGSLQQERGNLAGAIEAWEREVSIDSSRFETWVLLGLAYADLGRREDALRCLEQFLAHAPEASFSTDRQQVRELMRELETWETRQGAVR